MRHSTITDLVSAGLPLLTIAQISGTSAEMIERHYGHLASDAAVKALGPIPIIDIFNDCQSDSDRVAEFSVVAINYQSASPYSYTIMHTNQIQQETIYLT